jgi:UDP-GlcNAc:undecaprenyl-phosphate GlcNAc-1-phosphate transferase
MKTYLTFIISFLVTYFSMPIFRGLAVRFKVLDLPGGRKIHKVATPLLGGAALYMGLLAGALFNLSQLHHFLPVLLGATFILILGLINDIRELSARLRFLFQLLISLIVIGMGARVSFLPLGWWKDAGEVCITLFWLVGVTNAYNYLDGLDGLAAGSAVVNLACFAIILYMTGQPSLALLSVILIAACLGFLPYNFRKAKVFLGEAGSTLLGFILASIALLGNWAEDNVVKISIPILVLGVPIFDMIFTTVMRIREEKIKTLLEWLSYGGKDHFHHYLIDLGFQRLGAVIFIYFVTLSLGLSAIMVSNDLAIEAFLTLSQAAIIFGIIAALIVTGKRHPRSTA